ncbi:MAG TPA: NPCBM/NEW2 domain-containing protein, partial [Fibrobacteraceae bacterium]|nr:NPCBM/NEW2 domain-containing protein [Fibrobacteraceae bacterium]
SLDGESFRYGLGVHAKSKNTFDLNGSFSTFEAMAGLDDESACGDGASFVVLADGRELFRSLKMYSRDKQKVSLPMQGVRRLELVVEEGDNIDCDHAVWANAWLRRVE